MTAAERANKTADAIYQCPTYSTVEIIAKAIEDAIAEEREACAKLAEEDLAAKFLSCGCRLDVAAEIRKRGGQ